MIFFFTLNVEFDANVKVNMDSTATPNKKFIFYINNYN